MLKEKLKSSYNASLEYINLFNEQVTLNLSNAPLKLRS